LKRAITQGDTAADAHHDLGLVLYGRGQLEEAIHEFHIALDLRDGNDAEAHRNLGRALYESGALEDARKELETAIAQREGATTARDGATRGLGEAPTPADAPTARLAKGATVVLGSEKGKPSKGAGDKTMITASPRRPSFPEAHLDLGRVHYDLGHSVEAIAQLSKAVEGRSVFPRAHFELGRALVRAGRLGEAMTELKTAVEQQGGAFAEAHFQIGLLLSRQGDVESALDAYQTAVKQSGGVYPEAYYHMGLDHVRVRNNEAAVRAYRKAIEQRGGYFPEAHQDLGRVLYSMGDLEAANEEYSIAVRQRSPRQAEAAAEQDTQGGTGKARKTRRNEAAEELGAALRQAPATADASKGAEPIVERPPAREATGLVAGKE
jgi:tetratricopeptide (TPR) repeat protein